jgi:acyl dehydratase
MMVDKMTPGKGLPPFEFPIERGKIKEFARALEDKNPLYIDQGLAKSAGFASIPAPPTYTASILHHVPDENFLLNMMAELGMNVALSVHGESEFEYIKPITAGDVLTVQMGLKDTYQKESKRGGRLNFTVVEATYTNQDGEIVQKDRMTFIEEVPVG